VSLEEVCSQLKRYGVEIDADTLRRTYPNEDQLARVERNLWEMLRRIEQEGTSICLPDYLSSKSSSLAMSEHGDVSNSSARNFLKAPITDSYSTIGHLIELKDFSEYLLRKSITQLF
jgi:hypothetical protein